MRAALVIALLAAALASPASRGGAAIRTESGVKASVAVAAVPFPTNLTFDPTGRLWMTSATGGDLPTDGVWFAPKGARKARHAARGLHLALGLVWHKGELFVAHAVSPSRGRVTALGTFNGTSFARRRTVVEINGLGRHSLDSITPGPDGRLYLGVGSRFDATGPSGRIVSFRADGRDLRTEASGLRNPYGLAFAPGTSKLYVTDNARDDLGPARPPEELNAFDIAAARPHFGFPRCPVARCTAPVATLPAHASSDGLAISPDWRGDGPTAFVAQNGSSFAAAPTGNDVQAITLDGTPKRRRFAWGFDKHDPLGAAIGPDGALYVSLFVSKKVMRFSSTAGGSGREK